MLLAAAMACADSPVPYFDAPSGVPNSTTGIQNAVTGLFSGMRTDSYLYAYLSTGYARDLFYFVSSAPPVLTIPAGLVPLAPGDFTFNDTWDDEYLMIKQANAILTSLTTVQGYTAPQTAALQGVVQTAKAMEFMFLAETRDTLGIPLYAVDGNPASPPYCNKDVWQYILALLDSGLTDLNTAGTIPLPVTLPPGFAAVSSQAAPSTALGSFASLNRALAGKAGLEYAYAYARNTVGTHPTPTSAGSPYVPALQAANTALAASALYDPSVIAPPVAGPFQPNPYMVYYNFSGSSGDKQNQIFAAYFNYNTTWDLQSSVDTINDLRWTRKFTPDLAPVQVAQYAGVSSAKNYVPYSSVSAPIPILRAEELALVQAQIQLGLGNYVPALALVNQVRTQAGGPALTPYPAGDATGGNAFVQVRDDLMKEQRISTVFEMSGDRMIALRMYNLEAVEDTTWQAHSGPDAVVDAANGHPTDYHTTVTPIPVPEYTERGGAWTLSCP